MNRTFTRWKIPFHKRTWAHNPNSLLRFRILEKQQPSSSHWKSYPVISTLPPLLPPPLFLQERIEWWGQLNPSCLIRIIKTLNAGSLYHKFCWVTSQLFSVKGYFAYLGAKLDGDFPSLFWKFRANAVK